LSKGKGVREGVGERKRGEKDMVKKWAFGRPCQGRGFAK